jgi:hypothetical protein
LYRPNGHEERKKMKIFEMWQSLLFSKKGKRTERIERDGIERSFVNEEFFER